MALAQCRPPASDRHQGEVDVSHFVEGESRTSVARIPASVTAIDQEAERGSAMRTARVPAAVVVGREDGDPKTADLNDIARYHLMERHTSCGDRLEQPPRAGRDEKVRGRGDSSQRRQVGVVGMKV
jgi:hypothetical protein